MIYSKYNMFYKILDLKIYYKTENILIIFFILKIKNIEKIY